MAVYAPPFMNNAKTASTLAQSTATTTNYAAPIDGLGPSVSVTPGPTGCALVTVTAAIEGGGQYNNASVALSGGNTVAAADAYAVTVYGGSFGQSSTTTLFTGLAQSPTTFAMQYDTSGGTATFKNRTITVIPF